MRQKRKLQAEEPSGSTKPARQRRLVQQTLLPAAAGGGAAAAAAGVCPNEQLQPEPGDDASQLHELRVVSVRQAVRGGGFSASFEQHYAGWAVSAGLLRVLRCGCAFATPLTPGVPCCLPPPPLQVFNLTSKSQDAGMVQLSSFYCHNSIPVRSAGLIGWLWHCMMQRRQQSFIPSARPAP